MAKISNSELKENDIPSRQEAWKKIVPFALTFNGYSHWGSFQKCREVAQQGVKLYRAHSGLTQSLTELRTCLFFEARRWNRAEKEPTEKAMEYIHALMDAIRERVNTKEIA